MAEEIKIQASLEVTNGNFFFPKIGQPIQLVTQTRPNGGLPGTVTATTAGNTVSLSGLVTPRWAWIHNLDNANFVQVGHFDGTTFHPSIRLKANEWCVVPLEPTMTLRVKADTDDVELQVIVLDD